MELTHELEVSALADDVWAVYSSPELSKLLLKLIPNVFKTLDVVEGKGGLDTVLHVTYHPGSVPLYYKKRCVTMDHKNRVRTLSHIEGGYLDLGCDSFMDRFEIIEKGSSCIIKSSVVYEVPDELKREVVSHICIDTHAAMANAISKYVENKSRLQYVSQSNHRALSWCRC